MIEMIGYYINELEGGLGIGSPKSLLVTGNIYKEFTAMRQYKAK